MLPVKDFNGFVEQHTLFNKGSKLLAAVSGGMDSVFMVHLLKSAGYNFGIAHCNFQLRGDESDGDEQFCRQLAGQLGVPFHSVRFDTSAYAAAQKISIQMAARTLRYQWFEQVRQGHQYSAIALAHHQNDTIETILLNLVRGTGIAGLHGILPKNGQLVRPLLFLNREGISEYMAGQAIPYREDSSNMSTKYARNKIRLEVIPKLKELNPALENTFESNLQHFRQLEELLEQQVSELRAKMIAVSENEWHILLKDIRDLMPKQLLLFNLLQKFGFNETTVSDLISVLDKHPGRVFEGAEWQLTLDRDRLILIKNTERGHTEKTIAADDHKIEFGRYLLNVLHDDQPLIVKDNPMAVSIDSDLLVFPLTIRTWQQGDYFSPIGMKGRKKVSDLFIGQKVPLHQKTEIPLLVNGNNDIMWIGGYRLDERYKITDNTKKVTIFELAKRA
ncbi:MAG TPA: tRNA lysidine(34) synthetase TilS [Mucilaginibacter sp.]|nr:tRNA lysidine(34) synthetase TilS [Mucilaginibacter sp.]